MLIKMMEEMKDKILNESDDPKKLEEEYQKVMKFCQKEKVLKKDDTWCLLDSRWFTRWKSYAKNDGLPWEVRCKYHPGPIDNTDLFADNKYEEIKEHLIEGMQYNIVFEEGWNLLVDHYGIDDNQPPISRKVIEEGAFMKSTVVEIYPISLKLCNFEDKDKIHVENCTRVMTIEQLDERMRYLFMVPPDYETKLWNAGFGEDYEQMDKKETIQKYSLQKNQLVVMEVKKPGEDWTLKGEKKSSPNLFYGSMPSSNSSVSRYSSTSHVPSTSTSHVPSTSTYQPRNDPIPQSYSKERHTPGLCGLDNLGNTCFMSTALQCLSNVPALTNYFKSDKYLKELNHKNPLGMKGKMATTYAELIQEMWSGDNSSCDPRGFKDTVSQFQSRFLGYQQQDSQELLAFLIDGLHEDLNRISDKPYIETEDTNGRPDAVVAAEAWRNHMKRNNSIIVETLHGLYRSRVDCPECPRVSVTFDPFCFLTLPLPAKKDKTLNCTFVPFDSTEEMVKYKLHMAKSGSIKDLCKAISAYNQKPCANMTVAYVYNHRVDKVYKPSDDVGGLHERDDVFVFEGSPESTMIPVYMRYTSYSESFNLFGQPLLVSVHADNTTYTQLYKAILKASARFLVTESLKSDIADLMKMSEEELLEMKANGKEKKEQEVNDESHEGLFDLFQIKIVCRFGISGEPVEDNGQPINLADDIRLSADWSTNCYENHFCKNRNDPVTLHKSTLSDFERKDDGVLDLMKCMKLFTSKEMLEEDNTWYCSNCKKHQQAYKKIDLWVLPPVLIIHLKRFSNAREYRDKLDTFVDFPTRDLDLFPFIVNPLKDKLSENQKRYNLVAVSNHYGGMGGGHYTAFAKSNTEKKWYYFDDSRVSLSSEGRVVTKAAYMLVYQRQDVNRWFEEHTDKPFPFLNPFSPRLMDVGHEMNGTCFQFETNMNEDALNNIVTDDSMDAP